MPILSMNRSEKSLEDIFLELTEVEEKPETEGEIVNAELSEEDVLKDRTEEKDAAENREDTDETNIEDGEEEKDESDL